MKKETIIAIIFGIFLGSFLAIILITKNKEKQLEKNKTLSSIKKTILSPSSIKVDFRPLEITDPTDGSIFYKNTIVIKGVFTKDSLIIIQSPIKDVVIKNNKEEFSTEFPLALGENVIRISAYSQNKQLKSQEKELQVYYFSEQL